MALYYLAVLGEATTSAAYSLFNFRIFYFKLATSPPLSPVHWNQGRGFPFVNSFGTWYEMFNTLTAIHEITRSRRLNKICQQRVISCFLFPETFSSTGANNEFICSHSFSVKTVKTYVEARNQLIFFVIMKLACEGRFSNWILTVNVLNDYCSFFYMCVCTRAKHSLGID